MESDESKLEDSEATRNNFQKGIIKKNKLFHSIEVMDLIFHIPT